MNNQEVRTNRIDLNKFNTKSEMAHFKQEWEAVCRMLKKSKYNLNIPIVPINESEKIKHEK